MIGFYDYTVILTYASLISAGIGIVTALSGEGHPYVGMFFLLLCGLCDTFDGAVARTKKNRTKMEKEFGIQIDSLSDLVAFGILPACIGSAALRRSTWFQGVQTLENGWKTYIVYFVLYTVLILYMLAALIRLAYFNVTEQERQETAGESKRKEYTGLPVTNAALIFPTVLLIDFLCKPIDLTILYFVAVLFTGIAFLLKFTVKKWSKKGLWFVVGLGVFELLLFIIFRT